MRGETPALQGVPRPLSGGPLKFGPYWLDARLAVGGTAEVYLARPADSAAEPKRLILKRLLPHFVGDPEGRTMFAREAALHAAVHHENVVTVFGSGVAEDGEPYLAMEYIEGVDCYRLLRRLGQETRRLPVDVSVHIAREVLRALASVHAAKDEKGTPMGIIHRDVTPSNLYLSNVGQIKLGDFGIARSTSRATLRNAASAMLKGKFAYLSPEQVAGEVFDHRADLFSMGVVLAEMLIGKQLFSGTGQLAILLAIRDCRIDALREARASFPAGLFEVMEQALTREPSGRFQSAASFGASLKPFDPDPASSQNELGALVRYVQSAPSIESMSAVRDSAQAIRVACRDSGTTRAVAGATAPARDSEDAITQKRDNPGAPGKSAAPPKDAARGGSTRGDAHPTEDEFSRATGEYTPIPSFVETSQQSRLGPWPFARLVEAIATGQIGRGDKVDYMGRGLKPIEELEELARFLPARTITTSEVTGLGSPDFFDDVSTAGLLSVLLRVLESQETGVLFAEGGWEVDALARTPPYESTTSRGLDGAPRSHPGEGRSPVPPGAGLHLGDGRKELYFKSGKLHHVASNNATELLGEYLVRRQMISREELDFALAVLPRYGGRMGDTLISLGLVSAVDIFRAIREQGKDRLTNLFTWKKGSLTLYLNQPSPHVEFALDLDITTLMLAGLEAAQPNDAPLQMFRGRLDSMVGPSTTNRPRLRAIAWPPLVGHLFELTQEPATLRDVLALATRGGGSTADDVLRALQILLAGKLLAFY